MFNITNKTKTIPATLPGKNLIQGSDPASYLSNDEGAFDKFEGPKKKLKKGGT